MLTASTYLPYRSAMAQRERSLWPLAIVIAAAVPLGLLIYAVSARRPAINPGGAFDRELKRFEQPDNNAPAIPVERQQPSRASGSEQPVALEIDEPPLEDHHEIAAKDARDAAQRAKALAERHAKPKAARKTKPTSPAAPVVAMPPRPEPVSIRPPAKEDDAARIARETLSRACAALRRTKPGWFAKSYEADWQGTLIDSGGQTAHVAFGGGKWPDCDVMLTIDKVRQKWKVVSVQGGGFPAGWQW